MAVLFRDTIAPATRLRKPAALPAPSTLGQGTPVYCKVGQNMSAAEMAPANAGRSLSLLDPTYASKYIPIIASVSEHQPPAWPSYFTDLHVASVLMPAGLISLFWPLTAASMFLILYACTAVYFSGVMVGSRCLSYCPAGSRAS